jgi:glycosyltransferase involved in cell wall biosynthesis
LERSQIAILIPVYNEQKTILTVINQVKKYGTPIIINDASTDNSKRIIKKNKILHFSNKNNQGYDKTLNIGFFRAKSLKFKYIITFDGDGQHYTKDLVRIIFYLNKNYDLVVGQRSKFQRFSEFMFSKFSIFYYNIKDPLTGLKGYNIRVYNSLGYFDKNQSTGTKLLFHAVQKKFKIKKININIKRRVDVPRFGNVIKSNLYIIRSIILALIDYYKFKIL